MSDNRPPREPPAGVIPGGAAAKGASTALKRIPLVTTVSKEYEYFSEFIAEFGEHIYPQGMFVPSPRPRPKGARLKLDFKTRDGFQILDAICEVVRSDEALPGTLSGMWVTFNTIDDASRELVGRIASQREVSTGREKPPEVAGKTPPEGSGDEGSG